MEVVGCTVLPTIGAISTYFSTYFRFMELAGTGSSQANLTAEPAEAVNWCSKQSRAMGWALPFIGGAGRGRGGAA